MVQIDMSVSGDGCHVTLDATIARQSHTEQIVNFAHRIIKDLINMGDSLATKVTSKVVAAKKKAVVFILPSYQRLIGSWEIADRQHYSRLWEEKLQTAFHMSFTWVSHIAASMLTGS